MCNRKKLWVDPFRHFPSNSSLCTFLKAAVASVESTPPTQHSQRWWEAAKVTCLTLSALDHWPWVGLRSCGTNALGLRERRKHTLRQGPVDKKGAGGAGVQQWWCAAARQVKWGGGGEKGAQSRWLPVWCFFFFFQLFYWWKTSPSAVAVLWIKHLWVASSLHHA